MQDYKIEVQKRELSDKKSFVKSIRKNNAIPGIYYSHDSKESIPFSVSSSVLREALKSDSKVYTISVGGKTRNVIIKSIQYHPISDTPLHVDLYGVNMDQKVTLKVPIIITGQSIGIKEEGGVLNQNMTELEVECLPVDIPQNIEIDISHLAIGDTFRLLDVKKSDNLTMIGDPELLIASIVLPVKQEESVEEPDESDDLPDAGEPSDSIEASSEDKNDNNESDTE